MTATRLRAALQSIGWSQHHLARTLAVDERTVRRWCAGDYAVPVDVLAYVERLAVAHEAEVVPRLPARTPKGT